MKLTVWIFIKLTLKSHSDRLQATLGRRSLDIGSTRLVGEGEWANTRRAFDGLQLSLENFDLDALSSSAIYATA